MIMGILGNKLVSKGIIRREIVPLSLGGYTWAHTHRNVNANHLV